MPIFARIVGIPGAGKTTRGKEICLKVRERGFDWRQIGFSTFTRAARREAAERVAEAFGVPLAALEKEGWFRTIHSSAYRLLGVPRGSIVNFDKDWLKDALEGEDVSSADGEDDDEAWTLPWKGKSMASVALSLWDIARNRMCSFQDVYDRYKQSFGWNPAALLAHAEAEYWIERYEKAKERDDRLDFCDLILRFSGVRMRLEGPEEAVPQGQVPPVPVWIFDEAQDTSPLLDRAARRLSRDAIWVYLMGDREQGIYSWAGADPDAFMRWPVAQEEYLRKTWRCARRIIDFGLSLIFRSDDLSVEIKKLSIEARCPGGEINRSEESDLDYWLSNPAQATLVLARTNLIASEAMRRLRNSRIPFQTVKGSSRWPPIASVKLCKAFDALQKGQVIDEEAFRRILKTLPAQWFVRGTKAFYADPQSKGGVVHCCLPSLGSHGCSAELIERIANGGWIELIGEDERLSWKARLKYGDIVDNPPIRVSTIHGSKGLQASKVILLTRLSQAAANNLRTEEGSRQERRVWYVGATRCRDHLVLLRGHGTNYGELYDCL
jgi:superfamily I DNA/RNA helicase